MEREFTLLVPRYLNSVMTWGSFVYAGFRSKHN
uniref:Uncharacterized protein n=1 Tax=Anguilla anguilla TaxID=7936 RepID=A0A0E9U4Q5_ANGAN